MAVANLSRTGSIYTLVVTYPQHCKRVTETFCGTASQLRELLAQRHLESDHPKSSEATSKIFTVKFLNKIKREIHRDSIRSAPATGVAAVGFGPSLYQKRKYLPLKLPVSAPTI